MLCIVCVFWVSLRNWRVLVRPEAWSQHVSMGCQRILTTVEFSFNCKLIPSRELIHIPPWEVRKIIFKMPFLRDMLVPLEGIPFCSQRKSFLDADLRHFPYGYIADLNFLWTLESAKMPRPVSVCATRFQQHRNLPGKRTLTRAVPCDRSVLNSTAHTLEINWEQPQQKVMNRSACKDPETTEMT